LCPETNKITKAGKMLAGILILESYILCMMLTYRNPSFPVEKLWRSKDNLPFIMRDHSQSGVGVLVIDCIVDSTHIFRVIQQLTIHRQQQGN